MTNRLLPVAAQLTHGLGLLGAGVNAIGGAIRGDKSQGRQGVQQQQQQPGAFQQQAFQGGFQGGFQGEKMIFLPWLNSLHWHMPSKHVNKIIFSHVIFRRVPRLTHRRQQETVLCTSLHNISGRVRTMPGYPGLSSPPGQPQCSPRFNMFQVTVCSWCLLS